MLRYITSLCWLTASAFAIAGFSKLMDLNEFESQLATWRLLNSRAVRGSLVIGLPILEVAMFACHSLVPERRAATAWVMLLMLFAFSVAYTIEAAMGGAPACACFGILDHRATFQSEAAWVIGKNMLLAVPPAMMLVMLRANVEKPNIIGANTRGRRGFSMTEVLIVIVVIAALLAIAFPVIRHVRRSGRDSVTLNNLRQHAGVFLLYSQDYREQFPYFTKPLPGDSTWIEDRDGRVWKVHYFSAYYMWPVVMSYGYYNATGSRDGFRSPFHVEVPDHFWDYQYPCTFIADPAFWRPETRLMPPAQFRAIRLTDIAFPAFKVLMSDDCLWHASRRGSPQGAGGCVDGHAEIIASHRMSPYYRPGETSFEYGRHVSDNPLLHTLDGCSARDFSTR
ncbi:MAG: hypothetical protein HBSAPP03_24080 [Phycisphaerae bacterium]|nr:MAG: hypothetical protein HBSAPP03_24080 [Phycisphaerae bacterium]